MDCRHALERLGAAMDGELATSEALALDEHVRGCASCARAQASLQATRTELRHLPAETVSSGFDASLRARLANSEHAPRAKMGLLLMTGLAAALVGLAVWPGRGHDPGHRVPLEGPRAVRSTDSAARDCGLTGSAVLCRVDAPCADAGQCGRPGPLEELFTPPPVVEAW